MKTIIFLCLLFFFISCSVNNATTAEYKIKPITNEQYEKLIVYIMKSKRMTREEAENYLWNERTEYIRSKKDNTRGCTQKSIKAYGDTINYIICDDGYMEIF